MKEARNQKSVVIQELTIREENTNAANNTATTNGANSTAGKSRGKMNKPEGAATLGVSVSQSRTDSTSSDGFVYPGRKNKFNFNKKVAQESVNKTRPGN